MSNEIDMLSSCYKKYYNCFHLTAIFLLAVLIFWPVHSFSLLIGWDDQTFVTNHYTEDGWYSKNIYTILTEFYHGQYSPVNQIYYSTLFELFKYSLVYYHVFSVIIHLVNAILVYRFVTEITNVLFSFTPIKNAQVAFFTTLFFAISPINLEPVSWIAASKVLLYALFYMLALLTYIKYITKNRNQYYYLTLLFFIMSFGAKEQAVTLPFSMFLLDYVYNRNFKNNIIWLEKAPLLILSLLFALASVESQQIGVVAGSDSYPFVAKIPLFFYTLSEYLTKIILPVNLSYVYPFPFQIGENVPALFWIYPLLIPLLLYYLRHFFLKKWILFAGIFFLIHIVLVCNFFSLARHSIIADRYAYISTIGIYFFIVICFIKAKQAKIARQYMRLMPLLYLGYFAIYTHGHSYVWQSSITLKEKIKIIIESRRDFQSWKNKHIKKAK
jgi:hypothetical protein